MDRQELMAQAEAKLEDTASDMLQLAETIDKAVEDPGLLDKYILSPVKKVFRSEPVRAVASTSIQQGNNMLTVYTAKAANDFVFTFFEELTPDEKTTMHNVVRHGMFHMLLTGGGAFLGTPFLKAKAYAAEERGDKVSAEFFHKGGDVLTQMFIQEGGDLIDIEAKISSAAKASAKMLAQFLRGHGKQLEEVAANGNKLPPPTNRQQFKHGGNKR